MYEEIHHGWSSKQTSLFSVDRRCRLKRCNFIMLSNHTPVISEGGYGFVVKLTTPRKAQLACKVYKKDMDPELEMLGVDFDHANKKIKLNLSRQASMQRVLKSSGFVPTTLKYMKASCFLCHDFAKSQHKSIFPREPGLGKFVKKTCCKRPHYHAFMPWLDGNLEDYMKTKRSMTERLDIFLQVSKVVHNLAQHGILNPDLKLSNVLYKRLPNQRTRFLPCDVGGLCMVNKKHVDYVNDSFKRTMISDGQTRRMVGRVDEDDDEEYLPCQPHEHVVPHVWTVATSVNIYLKLQGIKSNFDLSPATHLTNQFSLLAFLMVVIGIRPPYYDILKSKRSLDRHFDIYPTVEDYVDFHATTDLRLHRYYPALRRLILKVWHLGNDWKLYGNEKTYAANLREGIKDILHMDTMRLSNRTTDASTCSQTSEHASPPRKVRRVAVLEPEGVVGVARTNT